MFHVVLYEPEIPANTGNIGRLCVATGATLHLVGRVGFRLDDRHLRRAGLDYWGEVRVERHDALADLEARHPADQTFCFSAHASRPYTAARFRPACGPVVACRMAGLAAARNEREEATHGTQLDEHTPRFLAGTFPRQR